MEANVTAALVPYTPFTYLGGAAAAADVRFPSRACLPHSSISPEPVLPARLLRAPLLCSASGRARGEETTYLAFLALPNQEESEEADGREGNSKG